MATADTCPRSGCSGGCGDHLGYRAKTHLGPFPLRAEYALPSHWWIYWPHGMLVNITWVQASICQAWFCVQWLVLRRASLGSHFPAVTWERPEPIWARTTSSWPTPCKVLQCIDWGTIFRQKSAHPSYHYANLLVSLIQGTIACTATNCLKCLYNLLSVNVGKIDDRWEKLKSPEHIILSCYYLRQGVWAFYSWKGQQISPPAVGFPELSGQ